MTTMSLYTKYQVTVAYCVIVMVAAVSSTPYEEIPGFHSTVLNAYDGNKSFSENFHVILDAICSTSVHCEIPVTSEKDKSIDEMDEPGELNHFNSTMIPDSIAEALFFLKNKFSSLKGCCTQCSCKNDCMEKSNCCRMRNSTLSANDAITKSDVKQECVAATIESFKPGSQMSKLDSVGLMYYMVTDCFKQNVNETLANKCRYPNTSFLVEVTPAHSLVTGRNYKNRFCAECNGDFTITLWHPLIIFSPVISLTGTVPTPTSAEELYRRSFFSRHITFIYEPPQGVQASLSSHRCLTVSDAGLQIGPDTCKTFPTFTDAENAFFKQACGYQNIRFETLRQTFENVFCFLCHDLHVTWDDGRLDGCHSTSKVPTLAFSAILDFDQTLGGYPQESDVGGIENMCKCTEFFDANQGICRQLVCPPGDHFINCQCQSFLSHVTGLTIMVYLDIVPVEARHAHKLRDVIGNSDKRMTRNLMYKTAKLLNSTWGPLISTGWILYRETLDSDSDEHYLNFYTVLTMKMDHKTDNRRVLRRMFHGLHNGLTTKIFNVPVRISLGRILKLRINATITMVQFENQDTANITRELLISEVLGNIYDTKRLPTYFQPLSKTVFCKRVELESREVEMLQNDSLSGISQTYLGYIYSERDNSMCLDEFESMFIQNDSSGTYSCFMYVLITTCFAWGLTPMTY